MHVSTRKGDSGYTRLLSGEKVSKHALVIEAVGTLDETNSLLGLARASSEAKRIKRILLQVQRHLFIIGAELSVPKGHGKRPKKTISEADIRWLERLIEDFEEDLALPPGFVAFGQEEGASHMDVARTSVRRAERIVVKMKREDMVENPHVLKYLNRLSDLIFLLACLEEKGETKKGRRWADPTFRKWTLLVGTIALALVVTTVILWLFYNPAPEVKAIAEHVRQMEWMHGLPPE